MQIGKKSLYLQNSKIFIIKIALLLNMQYFINIKKKIK